MANNKTENKTMQLQTKVSPEVYARLEAIGDKYGFSIFQLLRMLLDCIIRFMDDQHNLSEDLQRVIRMFDDMKSWGKSICLADNDQELVIDGVIYIMRAKGNAGYRVAMVERPKWKDTEEGRKYEGTETYNVQLILERVVEIINPNLYKHLRQLAVDEFHTESVYDTISTIVNLYQPNQSEDEFRKEFEDNDWHKGAKMHDDKRIQRRHSHSMDYFEGQQRLFDNDNPNEENHDRED